ncbi:hypothetical protein LTR48_001105 [Friedmanniomyces endolithicus]|uniref:Fatty acid desaturase domain-containing protein n=1 Tax=Rachicladosporium monterosium TaxID=1507873 RepID=A0ABR0LED6_9PEZI|nr:hypothetical protein LTR48_001105 [Friedmanniomyces endolithicus]KAK5147543.1 hypothetical protein LTR32_001046 [Rachicladosporium monterosium]
MTIDQSTPSLRRRSPSSSPQNRESPALPDEEVTARAKTSAKLYGVVTPNPAAVKAALSPNIHPYLTQPDLLVLDNLFRDVHDGNRGKSSTTDPKLSPETIEALADDTNINTNHDAASITRLKALNNPNDAAFQPTVFVTWDAKDIPEPLNHYIIRPYARLAMQIVRHPTDVVFLTHLLLYSTVNLGSAMYMMFYHFTYLHGVAHAVYTLWCAGSFTLMMHNHIHNNGPDDLSTTIRYQRDDVFHFLHYIGRFLLLIWAELPLYFYRKGKPNLALRALVSELASYAFLYYMTALNPRAATFAFLIPFVQMRIGLMIGNWGQHALVDELEPDSDFRSSITLVDVPSNRFCFNDGYHTAHHLNPLRHWREQPVHFLQSKEAYRDGRALVFHNIDYLMLTFTLLRKDYLHLADCLVPMGEQIGMSREEVAEMLRSKTRKFSEEEIRVKFRS